MHDWLEPHMKRCMKNSINIDGSINWMQHATVGYIYHIITQSVVTFRLVPTRIDRHPCRPYLRIASWSWRPFRRWITSPGTILGNRAGVRLNDATSAIWSVMVAQRPIAVFFGIDQYTIAWSRHKNRQSLCWDWCMILQFVFITLQLWNKRKYCDPQQGNSFRLSSFCLILDAFVWK